MGKQLISSEESNVHRNVGCMWGMFHILDSHHWRVKKVFHHKKKRHARYKKKAILQDQQNVVTVAEEPLLVSNHSEKSNAGTNQASSDYALQQKKDGKKTEGSLNREISIKLKNHDDVVEVISIKKNVLLKFLRDIDIGGKKTHQASKNKIRLTRSGSFPVTGHSKVKYISSSTFRYKQTEIWAFPKGEKLLAGTQAPKKLGTSLVKDVSYEISKPLVSDDVEMDSAMQQKPNITSLPSKGLSNHKGWNQVVIHQFKVIKQKIKHVLVEFKKGGHQTSLEAIQNSENIPDNEEEISRSFNDGVIREYKKSKSLSETKASDSNECDVRLMRRTSSLNESLDKYTQLFEKSLSKEAKWNSSKSKSLRLTNEDKIHKRRDARMFSRSNFSMPNLESLGFILHEALLDTNDIGNNAVESDNDVQSKSVSMRLNIDKSLDHFEKAEIDETVEKCGRDVNTYSLSDKIVKKIDETVTCDKREDIHVPEEGDEVFPQEKLETSCPDNTTSQVEGKEWNTRGSDASVTAKNKNKSFDNHLMFFNSYSENNSNFNYVKDVLEFSGFMENEHNQMRYTVDQPIKPSIFMAMEETFLHENEFSAEESVDLCDHQLLFNLVNEVLFEIYENSPTYFPRPFSYNYKLKPMPKGNYLLNQVWNSVSSYMSLRPELDQTLDDVVCRDLSKRNGWMNLQHEEECVTLEIEEMIIEDMLDEIIFSDMLEDM